MADLNGKRVALDEPGSGTLISARQILSAYGLKEADIRPEYIKPNQAGDKVIAGSTGRLLLYRRHARRICGSGIRQDRHRAAAD
ncbi:MAG: hypothetical protein IPI21_11965 [Propionivibrio sp.]|nr:hypothetical protein [Propionivibrio sp.]